ncbi:SIR2 family NAD-dependent protein deacylase [Herbidospora mongoliensis]|uniref:SIR2 family NAD-dependent protein deacylase n=1 Tax=Herbidospora mongoliensis TaxID=688067 RepID=UPI0008332B6A|nr:SIR2 family protein [Herbidospora mongoliensis]
MKEADWKRLVFQLSKGACTPFLGAGACDGILPSGRQLSRKLAEDGQYPFHDKDNLTKVTQFLAMRFGESVHVKEMISEELRVSRTPDFDDPQDPHGLLAKFPLPVYLTTNYDDFIFQSLKWVGKDPSVAMCRWNEGIEGNAEIFQEEAGWNPRPESPLVYHLHGRLDTPSSLVVTEDDYIEFITNLAHDRAAETPVMLPPVILGALTTRSLLFVGYSLQDWNFRVLFNGLQRAVPGINRRRHLSVQVAPDVDASVKEELLEDLERYYERWSVSIFWGTAAEFCKQLQRRMT